MFASEFATTEAAREAAARRVEFANYSLGPPIIIPHALVKSLSVYSSTNRATTGPSNHAQVGSAHLGTQLIDFHHL
jgi:hypothetical protein